MSLNDDYDDFMRKNEPKPEDCFSMQTYMPKRKIKIVAHLEDKEGQVVDVADLAEDLVKFIQEQMKTQESTPVNSQMFPMVGQFMTSIVPRFMGLNFAALMFEASSTRQTLLTFGLASMLFMQYVQQHELKIVTTTSDLSDQELEEYYQRSEAAEKRIQSAFRNALGVEDNEDPEDIS